MDSYHQELLKELPSLSTWHHIIDLGDGIKTAEQDTAYDPNDRWRLMESHLPLDLSGKTVLDLGCNSGYFSVKMKQRGASKVVAVDAYPPALKQVQFLSRWFDVDIETVYSDAHVYCLTTEERFDYVIFLGLFYHLKYGTIALDRLAEMTKEKLFFQTATIDKQISNFEPDENYNLEDRAKMSVESDFPRMLFLEKKFNNDWSNWWLCNDSMSISLLRNAGLKVIDRPIKEFYVCVPEHVFGKEVYDKLVFPRYGKGNNSLP